MKTVTFKNICSPSNDKTIIIGTSKKDQQWFFRVDSRNAAMQVAKAIMQKGGKVSLAGWQEYSPTADHPPWSH